MFNEWIIDRRKEISRRYCRCKRWIYGWKWMNSWWHFISCITGQKMAWSRSKAEQILKFFLINIWGRYAARFFGRLRSGGKLYVIAGRCCLNRYVLSRIDWTRSGQPRSISASDDRGTAWLPNLLFRDSIVYSSGRETLETSRLDTNQQPRTPLRSPETPETPETLASLQNDLLP